MHVGGLAGAARLADTQPCPPALQAAAVAAISAAALAIAPAAQAAQEAMMVAEVRCAAAAFCRSPHAAPHAQPALPRVAAIKRGTKRSGSCVQPGQQPAAGATAGSQMRPSRPRACSLQPQPRCCCRLPRGRHVRSCAAALPPPPPSSAAAAAGRAPHRPDWLGCHRGHVHLLALAGGVGPLRPVRRAPRPERHAAAARPLEKTTASFLHPSNPYFLLLRCFQ